MQLHQRDYENYAQALIVVSRNYNPKIPRYIEPYSAQAKIIVPFIPDQSISVVANRLAQVFASRITLLLAPDLLGRLIDRHGEHRTDSVS